MTTTTTHKDGRVIITVTTKPSDVKTLETLGIKIGKAVKKW